MDYEKKYKKAIEKAKEWEKKYILTNTISPDGTMAKEFKEIFPELAESEDERIRKEMLKELVESEDSIVFSPGKKERWIAYLEKQKEQKHPNGCFTCDEYKKGYEAGRFHGFTAGYNKAMKEQKPADGKEYSSPECGTTAGVWNEEDEKMLKNVLWVLESYVSQSESASSPSLITSYPTYYKEIDWLKSLRPQPIQLREAYKEGFQTARHAIALAFMQYCDKSRPNGKMCLSNGECEEIEKAFLVGDWEKIERYFHKYHWKPSEEQMSMLLAVIRDPNNAGSESCFLAFKSLYEDLKKLI